MLNIASDHGGFKLKTSIKEHLRNNYPEIKVQDFGPMTENPTDDYPDFVIPLAKDTALKNTAAIIICRNGIGVSMLANKFHNIRCGVCFSIEHVKSAVQDDNINVLALPSDYLKTKDALEIVDTWLSTSFSKKERHLRRLKKFETLGEKVQN